MILPKVLAEQPSVMGSNGIHGAAGRALSPTPRMEPSRGRVLLDVGVRRGQLEGTFMLNG